MKKIILLLLFAVIVILIFSPVNTSKENSTEVKGIVKNITEGGVKDAVFELENDSISYYINRGLENRFTLAKLNKDFVGKEVTISYAKNWTPLAPFGTTSKHLTQIKLQDSIIYTEFKK